MGEMRLRYTAGEAGARRRGRSFLDFDGSTQTRLLLNGYGVSECYAPSLGPSITYREIMESAEMKDGGKAEGREAMMEGGR